MWSRASVRRVAVVMAGFVVWGVGMALRDNTRLHTTPGESGFYLTAIAPFVACSAIFVTVWERDRQLSDDSVQ